MPEERKDTQPAAQKEGVQASPGGLEDGGEITAAADQLAAVTLADKDEAGAGTGTSESPQDSMDELHDRDPLSDPELWKPHPPTKDCPVCLVPLPLEASKRTYSTCCGKSICGACNYEHSRALRITNEKRRKKELPPLDRSCAFCRKPVDVEHSVMIQRVETLADKGDVDAMVTMALWCLGGQNGFPKDGESLGSVTQGR